MTTVTSQVEAEGYGIDSDDDNTFTDNGDTGYDDSHKATSYHQPQVSVCLPVFALNKDATSTVR